MHELVVINQPDKWIHYSSSPAQILLANKKPLDPSFGMKPRGLWITPEYAKHNWYDWCMSEDFRTAELNFIHDVTFIKNANILRLDTQADIVAFTEEYGFNILESLGQRSMVGGQDAIHWDLVATKYHGILIPEYHWDLRMNHLARWYYPWDCASGCIWNVSVIESIVVRPGESAGYVSREFNLKEAMTKLRASLEEAKKEQVDV